MDKLILNNLIQNAPFAYAYHKMVFDAMLARESQSKKVWKMAEAVYKKIEQMKGAI